MFWRSATDARFIVSWKKCACLIRAGRVVFHVLGCHLTVWWGARRVKHLAMCRRGNGLGTELVGCYAGANRAGDLVWTQYSKRDSSRAGTNGISGILQYWTHVHRLAMLTVHVASSPLYSGLMRIIPFPRASEQPSSERKRFI